MRDWHGSVELSESPLTFERSKGALYYLPNENDRQTIETAVRVFLSSGSGVVRDVMLGTIYFVLKGRGVSKLRMGSYTVGLTGERIYFRAKRRIEGRHCPGCGVGIYSRNVRILSVEEGFGTDTVHYGCSCGQIFYKKEKTMPRA